MSNDKKYLRVKQLKWEIIAVSVMFGAAVALVNMPTHNAESERNVKETACTPILAELNEVYELRDEKRARVESLLGQQETGTIPFGDQVVDYEYRSWQLQDAALDRRGDTLVREIAVHNCYAANVRE